MLSGDVGTTRPGPGIKPNKPFIAAGMRIEPSAITRMGDWHHAAGDRRGGAARRATCRAVRIPRIVRHAVQNGLSAPEQTELDVVVLPITMRPAASSRSLDGARGVTRCCAREPRAHRMTKT